MARTTVSPSMLVREREREMLSVKRWLSNCSEKLRSLTETASASELAASWIPAYIGMPLFGMCAHVCHPLECLTAIMTPRCVEGKTQPPAEGGLAVIMSGLLLAH